MMKVPSTTSRQWNLNVVPSGSLRIAPRFSAAVNASDSTSLEPHPQPDDHHHRREQERHLGQPQVRKASIAAPWRPAAARR